MLQLGIDVGGTFTDFVLLDKDGCFEVTKAESNHIHPTVTIAEGIKKLNVDLKDVQSIFYGSTVGLNALIQRKGAECLLITTKGFKDIYAIGRLSKKEMYNMFEKKHDLLIKRSRTIEIDERVNSEGGIVKDIDEAEVISKINEQNSKKKIEAIAISLINSYANPANELKLEKVINNTFPEIYTSISSAIIQQWYEYERTCSTVINAYVTPVIVRHIDELSRLFFRMGFNGSLLIMQSNGSVSHAEIASKKALSTLSAGPAAGIAGGASVAGNMGLSNAVIVDMGGTSFDVGILERGTIRMSGKTTIIKHDTLLASIDIYSIGAGGGSIAWIDEGGALQVGPRSAEANPGPVFYDKGGTEPTVSDADLVAQRLNPDYMLGGEIKIDRTLSVNSIKMKIADKLNCSVDDAALSIIEIIDNKMAYAIRSMTIEKGLDPSDFSLVAFGGAGALHASSIAGIIGIPRVIIPIVPSTYSAFGMIATDIKHVFVKTSLLNAQHPDSYQHINNSFSELLKDAEKMLDSEAVPIENRKFQKSADARYLGQEFTLNILINSNAYNSDTAASVKADFDSRHKSEFGFDVESGWVEFTNLRVAAMGTRGSEKINPRIKNQKAVIKDAIKGTRKIFFQEGVLSNCTIYERESIPPGSKIMGPAVIEEPLSATLLLPGDKARLDKNGNIIIDKEGRP